MKRLFIICILCIVAVLTYLYVVPHFITIHIKSHPINTEMTVIKSVVTSRNDTLTNIYYINLTKSADRNHRFLSELDKTMNPIRVDAISPSTLPIIKKPLLKCRLMLDSEYACMASHLKAIHTAYHDNQSWAIIAEDDAIIKKNINWGRLVDSAPTDWDILQIHTCCVLQNKNNKQSFFKYFDDECNLWIQSNDIIPSAAFYIIRRSGIQKLLQKYVVGYENHNWNDIDKIDLRSSSIQCQADLLLFDQMKRYVCTYSLIDIDKSKSTIHWSHDAWNDYSHLKF